MQYFVMNKQYRDSQFMTGQPNPLYTQVYPDQDFAPSGYWFWLKSASAHGFDVDSFDQNYVYLHSTELNWTDNTTFKRKHQDVPISTRCVAVNAPGQQIQVADTQIDWYASCSLYKSSFLGTIVNDLDAPCLWIQAETSARFRTGCSTTTTTATAISRIAVMKNNSSWERDSANGNGSITRTDLSSTQL